MNFYHYPGEALKRLLTEEDGEEWFCCRLRILAQKMNASGFGWCNDNLQWIVGEVEKIAESRGLERSREELEGFVIDSLNCS